MPQLKSAARVRETSQTQGQVTYVLLGPVAGYQGFSAWGANNYGKAHVTDGVNYEEGIYKYLAAPDRLERTHVLRSSNAGAAINWGAGTRTLRNGPISDLDIPRHLAKAVGGGAGTTVLTADEQLRDSLEFTGALTGARVIEVDATPWVWMVFNNTTGAFGLTMRVTGQAGVAIPQGVRALVYCDGTDVRMLSADVLRAEFAYSNNFASPGSLKFPRMWISGLVPSQAVDTAHDTTISEGECRDQANTQNLILAAALTKQIDAVWAAGNNAGGFFPGGGVAADTWYHFHLIRKDTDGTIDAGYDTSVTAANKPAGYTAYRHIFSVRTDGAANIIGYVAYELHGGGLEVWNKLGFEEFDENILETGETKTLTRVPTGISVIANGNMYVENLAGGTAGVRLYPTSVTDENVITTGSPLLTASVNTGAATHQIGVHVRVRTDTSAQVDLEAIVPTNVTVRFVTHGWEWSRR